MDNIMRYMPSFTKLTHVEYKFAATQENIDKMADCIKNVLSETNNDVYIDIHRDNIENEIVLNVYE